jgi:hypothetical protein
VQSELQRHEHLRHHRAIVEGDSIVIYAPSVNEAELRRLAHRMGTPWQADELVASSMKRARYDPVVKLVRAHAGYDAHRMTYRGDGGWSWPLRSGSLPQLVRAVVPVIGTDAFFELM